MSSLMDRFSEASKAEQITVAGIDLGARLLTPREFEVVLERMQDPDLPDLPKVPGDQATDDEFKAFDAELATVEAERQKIVNGHIESMSIVIAELFVELDADGLPTDKQAFTPAYIKDKLPTRRAKELLAAFMAVNSNKAPDGTAKN